MKLNKSLVVAFIAVLYALIRQFLPDFPISEEVFGAVVLGLALYVVAKLGGDIVEPLLLKFKRQ
jgi:hypothetical protein